VVVSIIPKSSGDLAGKWDDFRRQMPVTRRWAYFDHAAVAPLPEASRSAISRWAEQAAYEGDVAWPQWAACVEELRQRAADLVGAELAEIALVRNTTEGISLVAEGFPWNRGDNVVTLADEFPSNQYPWMNLAIKGVQTRRVPTDQGRVDLDRLRDNIDDRTRIVTVSWISYSSGWRNDLDHLAELAHDAGALLFVDAIQGLGVFPLDVRKTPLDFFCADGHKWLLGPEGAGVFFVRSPHLDRLRPLGVGWNSVAHSHDFSRIELNLKPTAARYEGGSQNMVGMIGLCESVKILTEYGPEAIAGRIVELTDIACRRLSDLGCTIFSDRSPEHRSGIVVFERPGCDPSAARQFCLDQGVVLSSRGGRLRISPHAYNNSEDIDRLVEAIGQLG
jgi:selenocysteine lyase/cysteine desulfurase